MITARTIRSLPAVCVGLCLGLSACKPQSSTVAPPLEISASTPADDETPQEEPTAEAKVYPDPPPASAPKPFDFPDVETFTLKNGLRVYVVPNDEVPLVSAQLVIRAGAMDSEYIAPFTASMLGEGTRARSKAKLDEAIEYVGGRLSSGAGMHVTYVVAHVLQQDLKLGLILMADEVMNSIFPEEALAKQKQQAKTAISVVKSQPQVLASVLFDMVAYPEGHPYGRPIPSNEEIDAIGVADIKKFHETFYKANNAFLVLTGAVDMAKAKPIVERALGRWAAAKAGELPANPLNQFKEFDLPKKLVVHLVDRPASAQAEVLVGNLALARNHPDWVKLEVANSVLGDDASGRLFQDIREERGLTYGIYAELDGGQAPGTFSISTRTRTKSTGAIIAAIFEHVERIRTETPSNGEVKGVVDKLVGGFPLELETPNQIASKVREALIYNLPPDYWEGYRADLLAVEAGDVADAANKYIHPVPHVVVVGKADDIAPQLEKTFPGAEVRLYDAELRPKK